MSEETTIGQRVQFYRGKLWLNHQEKMAADLQVSQPAISLVVNGQRRPSYRFLASLGKHPQVNATWLLTGEGSPLLAEDGSGGSFARLPVVESLSPGCPSEHHGPTVPVAEAWSRPTRYCLRLRADEPAVGDPELNFDVGDLIVLETDPEYWQTDLQRLRGKLVAVRLQQEQGVSLLLGRAVCDFESPDEPCRFFANVFDVGRVPLQVGTATMPAKHEDVSTAKEQGKQLRAIQLDKSSLGPGRRTAAPHTEPQFEEINATVIAVGIQLLRDM